MHWQQRKLTPYQHAPIAGVFLLLAFLLIGGCSSQRTLESDLGLDDAPDWVNQGTQAVDNAEGRLLQGVGMAPTMSDQSLQRSTADNRARAEIARILSTFVDSTIKDYSATTGNHASADVEQVLQSTTRAALAGARIIARWRDPDSGTLYAFAELDMQQVENLLSTSTALSGELQRYLSTHGEQQFKQLIKENAP
ncbi:MAG TPA: LPP20 family lipoprotein [Motiliproteus sp.]